MGIINNFPSGNIDLSAVTATAGDIRENKKILGSDGNIITGNLVTRSTNDIIISPGSVHINPGIYSGQSGFDKTIPNWPITGLTFPNITPSYQGINSLVFDIDLPTIGGISAISRIGLVPPSTFPTDFPRPYVIGRIENLMPFIIECLENSGFLDVLSIRMDNSSQKFYDSWCFLCGASNSAAKNKGIILDAEIRDTSLHIELSIPNPNEGFIYNYGGRATITNYGFHTTGNYMTMIICQYT